MKKAEEFISREGIDELFYGCLNAAVIDYGDRVIGTLVHCWDGVIAEVYELVDDPVKDGLDRSECRCIKIAEKKGFPDTGHAIEWALKVK